MNKITRGFTLIELLIVIALLGALAVALLAALDPLEQIKKGTDTGVRNTVSEIAGAMTRYASVKSGDLPFVKNGPIPWEKIKTSTDAIVASTIPEVGGVGPSGSITVGQIAIKSAITAGELKADFFTLAGEQLNNIWITGQYTDTVQKIFVCFRPTAKSFLADKNTKYYNVNEDDGTMSESSTCATSGTGIDTVTEKPCYWCAQ